MGKAILSKHAKGRLFKRLRRIGVREVDIKKYKDMITKLAEMIPKKTYIKNPMRFRNIKWKHGLLDIVIVDDYFRNLRIVVTVIF